MQQHSTSTHSNYTVQSTVKTTTGNGTVELHSRVKMYKYIPELHSTSTHSNYQGGWYHKTLQYSYEVQVDKGDTKDLHCRAKEDNYYTRTTQYKYYIVELHCTNGYRNFTVGQCSASRQWNYTVQAHTGTTLLVYINSYTLKAHSVPT